MGDGAGTEPGATPDTGGPLFVSPAGEFAVSTDALQAHSDRLGHLSDQLTSDSRRLRDLPHLGSAASGATARALSSEALLEEARTAMAAAAHVADRAKHELSVAIVDYTWAEHEAHARALGVSQTMTATFAPFMKMFLPGALLAGVGAAAVLKDPARQRQLGDWLMRHPEIYTSPKFVEAVRMSVMSADDAAGGMAGLPPGAMAALLASAGYVGVQGGAVLAVEGARQFGLLQETDVRISTTSSATHPATPNSAALGVEERLARVPEGDQVRIEKYDAPGAEPRYVVYVGPTETFSPALTSEPWDLSSNIGGVAGMDSASLRATEMAMTEAGITADSPVELVGFSQGGLVAARLAASGDWHAVGLETHGAPTGNIELPRGLAGLAIRNSDDFVPALAGPQLDHTLTQVERRAFDEGADIPTDKPGPAHQRGAYVATATAVDAAQSDAVQQQIRFLDSFMTDYTSQEGSTVTVTKYHAERVP
ncbi:MAG TPA: hypothetical protein VNT53_07760 [Pseudolysinimonas sp.]|nr:hypothetical protein [Pseudolysinimonas sp.]